MKIQPKRGAVLLMVLGFLAILAFVTLRATETAIRYLEERYLVSNGGIPDGTIRNELASGIEAGLAAIQIFRSANNGLFNPTAEGWGSPLETLEIAEPGIPPVRIRDDSTRIPLLLLDRESLKIAFESIGVDPGNVSELTDTLIDWTDEDEEALPRGGEELNYRSERGYGGFRIKPPNTEVRNFESLSAIPVFREVFFFGDAESAGRLSRLQASFTLEPVPVNLNAAPPEILELIEEISGVAFPYSLSREAPAERDTTWQPTLRDSVEGELPEWVATASQRITIRAEIARGERSFYREDTFSLRGADAAEPSLRRTRSGLAQPPPIPDR